MIRSFSEDLLTKADFTGEFGCNKSWGLRICPDMEDFTWVNLKQLWRKGLVHQPKKWGGFHHDSRGISPMMGEFFWIFSHQKHWETTGNLGYPAIGYMSYMSYRDIHRNPRSMLNRISWQDHWSGWWISYCQIATKMTGWLLVAAFKSCHVW